jgi:acetoin utilization deacetylase AcuC-like enzyme
VRTGLVTDPLFLRHDTGPGHPECAERLPAILDAVEGLPLVTVEPRDAAEEELCTVHAPGYVESVRRRIRDGVGHLDPDTAVCPDTWAAAVRAAGCALALGESLLEGRIEAGFAAVRPPGHHACRARAMGFCVLNNIALLARFLHDRGRSVCIVDWDVHHGNGTVDILLGEPAIGYVSLHQSPFFPGTGWQHTEGEGQVRNFPLPPGSGDRVYEAVLRTEVLPWIEERAPDVILVSAGFDALATDPLAGMELSVESFARFTEMLLGRPILSLLEGGYDLVGLGAAVRAHLEVLTNA